MWAQAFLGGTVLARETVHIPGFTSTLYRWARTQEDMTLQLGNIPPPYWDG